MGGAKQLPLIKSKSLQRAWPKQLTSLLTWLSVCLALNSKANLFLVLFMDSTTLFGIIHGLQCTISITFTLIYNTFNKKF